MWFPYLHFPGENNCLICIFPWLSMYLLIKSKMGKHHLNPFKLTQYNINLVLLNSSLLELFDLYFKESPSRPDISLFSWILFTIIRGIASPVPQVGHHFLDLLPSTSFTSLSGWCPFSTGYLRKSSGKSKIFETWNI